MSDSAKSPNSSSSDSQSGVDARSHYQACAQNAQDELNEIDRRHSLLTWLRTLFFAIAAPGLILGYFGETYPLWCLTLGWTAAAAFLVAIVWHEHLRLQQLSHRSDQQLFQHLLARLQRQWDQIPSEALLPEFAELPYADDLDIAGDASLLSLLSLAGTHPGKRTLQRWITEPALPAQVAERQQAIRCLIPARDLRLKIIKTIRASDSAAHDVYGLPQWGRSENWLDQHRAAHGLSYLGPALIFGGAILLLVAGSTANRIQLNLAVGLLGAGFLVNILVTVFWVSWIHDIFLKVTGEHRAVYRFANVFDALGTLPHDDGLLDQVRSVAVEQEDCAHVGFSKLTTIVRLANFQRDPLLYVVYLILQLTLLWDFRILKLLERWKTKFGNSVGTWFDALGNCEALICGATLADEYPQWAFPDTSPDPLQISALGIGHPLLPDDARVSNDLELEPTHPLLLVTGSNMAGKSTFMRALGLNVLLARTGSPVCAAAFSCPYFELATSIRVRDSLRDGVSFFMAELRRLKEVVDMAQETARSRSQNKTTPPILFLLDEVLQGTNTRERQIAVASVLEKLLNSGAMGLVSTHDLDLAAADEVRTVSQIVHFREYFERDGDREVMRFDYQMRPGPTPTTNALKLLALVGLEKN